jgi:hypothetical protein
MIRKLPLTLAAGALATAALVWGSAAHAQSPGGPEEQRSGEKAKKPRISQAGGRAGWKDPTRQEGATPAGPGIQAAVGGAAVENGRDPDQGLIPDDQLLAVSGLSAPEGSGGGPAGGPVSSSNVFVNDPCLDPPPNAPGAEKFRRTVQSETTVAVLNSVESSDDDHHEGDEGDDDRDDDDGSGRLMVAGYNDSFGFYNNTQGLSGFSYSTDGGKSWIDGGGLPPRFPTGLPAGTPGTDTYFGDPVVRVHHRTKTFYYSSIYLNNAGIFTLAVNRGHFHVAPQQVPVESKANTRCAGDPSKFGVPDPPASIRKRVIWEPPVEAVVQVDPGALLDKEWLYVDQKTGFLYLTYTRFGSDGSTPLEMVRSFDGGHTWTPPTIIVPNLDDTFNTATQAVVTPTGRVIVTWLARTFLLVPPTFPEIDQRIETAFSDDGGNSFGPPVIVKHVRPQREPRGYNRGRTQILNVPFIAVDKGRDDGVITRAERRQPGFGNVYITYFNGRTPVTAGPPFARSADILLSTSTNDGTSYGPAVKVNDDDGSTSHVFPSIQVNRFGEIFVTWLDRRVDPARNLLTDTYGDISNHQGLQTGTDIRITDVSTDWVARADARPNFGDYNSSEVINFEDFVSIWADGRFPTPVPLTCTPAGACSRPADQAATPDSLIATVASPSKAKAKEQDDQ